MSVSVGIDLGTTYSAVAVIDKETNLPRIVPNSEGNKITPSVIQFTKDGMIFGVEAESAFNSGESDCAATFKRSMGKQESYCIIDGKPYTPVDLSALLLKHLKEEAEAELGETISLSASFARFISISFFSRSARAATFFTAPSSSLIFD